MPYSPISSLRWFGSLVAALWLAGASAAQTIPSGGVSLVTAADLATEGSFREGATTGGAVAVRSLVDVSGQPFARAARIDVQRPTGDFWSSALSGANNRAVATGDVVLVHFFMRAVQTTDETGAVFAQLYAEGPAPGFTKSISRQVSAGPEWVEQFVPFEVVGDYPTGQFSINFGFGAGSRPQILDLAAVEVIWFGKSRTLAEMPRTSFHYDGRAADAPWRAAAAARIDQYRKRNYGIRVTGVDDQPVPGATVRMRLRRHGFPFGTAFQAARVANPANAADQTYRAKLVELFNAGSTENDLKWPPWEGDWGSGFQRAQTVAALDWLRLRGLQLRGHVLVWPSERNLPNSIRALLPTRDPSIPQRVRNHIMDIVTATRDHLTEWDVLNEPYDNKDLMEIFGNPIMVDWFKTARDHHPSAKLYINDYGILSGGGLNTAHQDHYEQTIRYLLEQGAPLDGIGMQGHFESSPTGMARVWTILERYANAFPGLAIKITEFDVDTDDEQLQADYTRDFLTMAFSHPAVAGFQLWGFWEEAHWRAQAAMYRTNWSEKPNGAAFRRLVHGEWWTDETRTAGADGRVSGRGFLGEYDLIVSAPGRATVVQRATLDARGLDLTVVLPDGGARSRLINLSTRGQVGTGENVMIAGFVIRGGGAKDVLIRGIGPQLMEFNVTGVLSDPRLAVYRLGDDAPFENNEDWEPALASLFSKLGAFSLNNDSRSAALSLALPPNGYSVHLSGVANGTGVGLIEVYDAAAGEPVELINLSTRGVAGVGDQTMIVGFVIQGTAEKRVLIRGVGPTLAQFSVNGALADPVCTLYRMRHDGSAELIARNDDWEDGNDREDVITTSVRVGAFPLGAGSRDAVLLSSLVPGVYSAHLTGSGATGVGLVEVYAVD